MLRVGTGSRKWLFFVVLPSLVVLLWHSGWVCRAMGLASGPGGDKPSAAPGIGLSSYRVTIEARSIDGLQRNVSGLTYNAATGTLFAAINRPSAIAELSTEGQLLRHIPLPELGDPEGITHIAGELFLVSDESDNELHWLRIRSGVQTAEIVAFARLPSDFEHRDNLGFEGVSWDEASGELLVVNEKRPRRVLIVHGLQPAGVPSSAIEVIEWSPRSWLGLFGRDLASVTTHGPSGNLLILSEESAIMAEYSRGGELLGVMPLWCGLHGLKRTVPQAEGIALGPDGAIYIVSEPNLFYVFRNRTK